LKTRLITEASGVDWFITGDSAVLRGRFGRFCETGCQTVGEVGIGSVCVGYNELFSEKKGQYLGRAAGCQGGLFPAPAGAAAGDYHRFLGSRFFLAAFRFVALSIVVEMGQLLSLLAATAGVGCPAFR
jgi:hypothetical protein